MRNCAVAAVERAVHSAAGSRQQDRSRGVEPDRYDAPLVLDRRRRFLAAYGIENANLAGQRHRRQPRAVLAEGEPRDEMENVVKRCSAVPLTAS